MRHVGTALVCLILGGCAIPLPLSVASFVVGTGSALSTGKSVPGHLLSFVREQDCAMWHVVKGERICQQLPAEEVIAIREQKRQRHRRLFTHEQAKDSARDRLALTPDAVDDTVASAGKLDFEVLNNVLCRDFKTLVCPAHLSRSRFLLICEELDSYASAGRLISKRREDWVLCIGESQTVCRKDEPAAVVKKSWRRVELDFFIVLIILLFRRVDRRHMQ